jgi:hypothetical protein
MENLFSLVLRVLFFGAFALLGIALFEQVANLLGQTLLRGSYSSGRLMELSAVLLVFVITLLLRQIRDGLAGRRPSA